MSNGTQPNGLPTNVLRHDTVGSHDWADTSTWPAVDDSGWVVEPEAGEVLVLQEAHVYFSENIIMHENGQLLVEFYMDGNPDPVKTITYADMRDWIARAFEHYRIPYDGATGTEITGPVQHFVIPFSQPPILWSSAGVDALGNPKLNKMIVKIGNDSPYQKVGGGNAEMGRARYVVDIYADPDVT